MHRSVVAILTLFAVLVGVIGCARFEAGGGGMVHIPPQSVSRKGGDVLVVEFSVATPRRGVMASTRFASVTCQYRGGTSGPFTSIPMTVQVDSESSVTMTCSLPAIDGDHQTLDYNISSTFDGVGHTTTLYTVSLGP